MHRFAIGLLILAALGGCRRGERELPQEAREREAPQARVFAASDALMFVYAGVSGRFETCAAMADVPEASRRVVRVIEPTAGGAPRGDYDQVYVVDLRSVGDTFEASVMPRAEFERRALAALPPGQLSRMSIPGGGGEQGAIAPHDDIILYGTSWCGACKQARTFLTQRGVAFIDRDVEKDAQAAAELAAKARAAGISATGVPIIDVRGKLLVGFDAARLATLVGGPI